MSFLLVVSLIGVVAVALLVWLLLRVDHGVVLDRIVERRRSTSNVSSRGELVDGSRHIDVALSVSDSMLFYQNEDLDASLPLHYVREVEYDNALSTGQDVPEGRVLRLRCWAQVFEFVVPAGDAAKWQAQFPPMSFKNTEGEQTV